MDKEESPAYIGDLIPSVATYFKAIETYEKGINASEFYEEPMGEDFIYPDW
tara:strand:+ start:13010 stop:13162 length:153 start_codon:yes stop_codon:yes gene_type:complete